MRGRRWYLPTAIAVLVPGLLLGWTLTAVAAQETSPTPSPGSVQSAPAGDPQKGAQVFGSAGCVSCHGANLEGGIGARLNPIQQFPGVAKPLDPSYLETTIRSGRSGDAGFAARMPAFGTDQLSDQDLQNIIAYIVDVNQKGTTALGPVELARSDVFWVTLTIVGLVGLTYLLARYNMRWVGRRSTATRENERAR